MLSVDMARTEERRGVYAARKEEVFNVGIELIAEKPGAATVLDTNCLDATTLLLTEMADRDNIFLSLRNLNERKYVSCIFTI